MLNILQYPDKRLRKIAKPVKKIDLKIRNLINAMFDVMYRNRGIGLAATQINYHYRIVVIDISSSCSERLVLINPIILKLSGKIKSKEGCLSISGTQDFIIRSKYIKVKALDINGNNIEINGEDLLSACIQHEIDHLNGILFIDHLSELKRYFFIKKIKKMERMKLKL